MKINTSRKSGFTLVEIMIVVAIIGLLAAIAIPNFVRARRTAQANSCVNNLRLIDSAKQQLLLEQPTATPDETTTAPYLGRGALGQFPTCPTTGTEDYTVGAADVSPTCANDATEGAAGFPHLLP